MPTNWGQHIVDVIYEVFFVVLSAERVIKGKHFKNTVSVKNIKSFSLSTLSGFGAILAKLTQSWNKNN